MDIASSAHSAFALPNGAKRKAASWAAIGYAQQPWTTGIADPGLPDREPSTLRSSHAPPLDTSQASLTVMNCTTQTAAVGTRRMPAATLLTMARSASWPM
jgi:hypothetical protein